MPGFIIGRFNIHKGRDALWQGLQHDHELKHYGNECNFILRVVPPGDLITHSFSCKATWDDSTGWTEGESLWNQAEQLLKPHLQEIN